MQRTKLWQNAGSSLIQGSSRHQKPFVADWLLASAVSFLVSCALLVALSLVRGTDVLSALRFAWIPAAAGSLAGSAPAIWIAGKYGSLKRWRAGAIAGVLVSLLAAWLFATYLVTQLNG